MKRLSKRDKRALIGAGVLGVLYVLVFHLILPYYDAGAVVDANLEQRKRVLQGAVRSLQDREVFAAQLAETDRVMARYEARLLEAQDAATATTQLDEIVRRVANDSRVTLTKTNPLQEKKVGEKYTRISIQITVDGDLASITTFLYALATHQKFLLVEDFRMSRFRLQQQLQPYMNVTALARLSS